MQELEVGGVKYRTGTLDAFKQFHIFRKLMPLFSGMGETAVQRIAKTVSPEVAEANPEASGWSALGPISQAISEMSQQDSEYVLRTSLSAVQRWNGAQWVKVTAPSGDLMFEDIDLMGMLQLTFAVLQDNLGGFFPGRPLNGSGAVAEQSPSNQPI